MAMNMIGQIELLMNIMIIFLAKIMLIDTLFNVKLDEFNQNNLGSNLR